MFLSYLFTLMLFTIGESQVTNYESSFQSVTINSSEFTISNDSEASNVTHRLQSKTNDHKIATSQTSQIFNSVNASTVTNMQKSTEAITSSKKSNKDIGTTSASTIQPNLGYMSSNNSDSIDGTEVTSTPEMSSASTLLFTNLSTIDSNRSSELSTDNSINKKEAISTSRISSTSKSISSLPVEISSKNPTTINVNKTLELSTETINKKETKHTLSATDTSRSTTPLSVEKNRTNLSTISSNTSYKSSTDSISGKETKSSNYKPEIATKLSESSYKYTNSKIVTRKTKVESKKPPNTTKTLIYSTTNKEGLVENKPKVTQTFSNGNVEVGHKFLFIDQIAYEKFMKMMKSGNILPRIWVWGIVAVNILNFSLFMVVLFVCCVRCKRKPNKKFRKVPNFEETMI